MKKLKVCNYLYLVPCIPCKRSRSCHLSSSFRPCKHLHFLDNLSTFQFWHTPRSSLHRSGSTRSINTVFINMKNILRLCHQHCRFERCSRSWSCRNLHYCLRWSQRCSHLWDCSYPKYAIRGFLVLFMLNLEALRNICVRIDDFIWAGCCFIFFCCCTSRWCCCCRFICCCRRFGCRRCWSRGCCRCRCRSCCRCCRRIRFGSRAYRKLDVFK